MKISNNKVNANPINRLYKKNYVSSHQQKINIKKSISFGNINTKPTKQIFMLINESFACLPEANENNLATFFTMSKKVLQKIHANIDSIKNAQLPEFHSKIGELDSFDIFAASYGDRNIRFQQFSQTGDFQKGLYIDGKMLTLSQYKYGKTFISQTASYNSSSGDLLVKMEKYQDSSMKKLLDSKEISNY